MQYFDVTHFSSTHPGFRDTAGRVDESYRNACAHELKEVAIASDDTDHHAAYVAFGPLSLSVVARANSDCC